VKHKNISREIKLTQIVKKYFPGNKFEKHVFVFGKYFPGNNIWYKQ
jgi:hypothetical protein